MSVGKQTGKASISFTDPVYIQSTASVVGPKEGDGPLKEYFDMICEDSMFGEKTWESAESTMQKEAATLAIGKAGLTPHDIRMVFAGDLLRPDNCLLFRHCRNGHPILWAVRCLFNHG